jgi:hypothetical protein
MGNDGGSGKVVIITAHAAFSRPADVRFGQDAPTRQLEIEDRQNGKN